MSNLDFQSYPAIRWWSRLRVYRKRIRVMPPRAYRATKDDYEGLGRYKYLLMRLAINSFKRKGCRIR